MNNTRSYALLPRAGRPQRMSLPISDLISKTVLAAVAPPTISPRSALKDYPSLQPSGCAAKFPLE